MRYDTVGGGQLAALDTPAGTFEAVTDVSGAYGVWVTAPGAAAPRLYPLPYKPDSVPVLLNIGGTLRVRVLDRGGEVSTSQNRYSREIDTGLPTGGVAGGGGLPPGEYPVSGTVRIG